jgi:hypothetical protein
MAPQFRRLSIAMHKPNKNMKMISKSFLAGLFRSSYFRLMLALLPMLAAGCAGTFREVRTVSPGRAPAERPTVLVLGEIGFTDASVTAADKEVYRLKFQEGLEAWFGKTNIFESVVLSSPGVTPHGIILSGTITEVNKGSEAARFWVGMGAGQSRIQGKFEIKDAAGNSLTQFTARRSYLGGLGIGGAGMVSMDELASRLGKTVAETVTQWLHGQKVE